MRLRSRPRRPGPTDRTPARTGTPTRPDRPDTGVRYGIRRARHATASAGRRAGRAHLMRIISTKSYLHEPTRTIFARSPRFASFRSCGRPVVLVVVSRVSRPRAARRRGAAARRVRGCPAAGRGHSFGSVFVVQFQLRILNCAFCFSSWAWRRVPRETQTARAAPGAARTAAYRSARRARRAVSAIPLALALPTPRAPRRETTCDISHSHTTRRHEQHRESSPTPATVHAHSDL